MGSPVFVGFQRILVAFDASPHAEHALNVALSMAGDMKAKLFVLAVIRPPEPAESAEFHAVLDEGRERFEISAASRGLGRHVSSGGGHGDSRHLREGRGRLALRSGGTVVRLSGVGTRGARGMAALDRR